MPRRSMIVDMAAAEGVTEAATVDGEVAMVEAEDVEGAEEVVVMVRGGEGSFDKILGD